MNRKVATLTFANSDNYGAVLQAYALQKAIQKKSINTEILNYRCQKVEKPYSFQSLKKNGLKSYIVSLVAYIIKIPRRRKFREFRREMNFTSIITKSELQNNQEEYAKYIVGSDQIWNPYLTDDDATFFLDFITDRNKKFSYAASFGVSEMKEPERDLYRELLQDFTMVSVREEAGKVLFDSITNKESTIVLDPTMLIDVKEWEKMISMPKQMKKDYIFVYQMGVAGEMLDYARKLAKNKKMKLVVAPFPIAKLMKASVRPGIGPKEWLGLIRGAKYIVTDSFHGTVFSVLFNKQFLVFVSPMVSAMSSRVETLLSLLGLEERIVRANKQVHIDDKIDYVLANSKLQTEIKHSQKFLNDILDQ